MYSKTFSLSFPQIWDFSYLFLSFPLSLSLSLSLSLETICLLNETCKHANEREQETSKEKQCSSLHWIIWLSNCLFLYKGVYKVILKLSICDVIVSQKVPI